MPGWRGVHLLYLGGAKGGAIVRLYQNGGYDERKDNENDTSINVEIP